jgi:hypothetical protein
MVPVYSVFTLLSLLYYRRAIYAIVVRELYQMVALASYFSLVSHYVAPDLHGQKEYFRAITPRPWKFPFTWLAKITGGARGPFRTPRSGLTWFNIIFLCIAQYYVIDVVMVLAAVLAQLGGRYCQESLHPAFAHVYFLSLQFVSNIVASQALSTFHHQLKPDLQHHQFVAKKWCVQTVIFLSFFQTFIMTILFESGIMRASKQIQAPDVRLAFTAMLLCFELAILSVLHIFFFSWQEYRIENLEEGSTSYQGGFGGHKAIIDALNVWDLVKSCARAFRWMAIGRKRRHDEIYRLSANIYPTPEGAAPIKDSFTDAAGQYGLLREDCARTIQATNGGQVVENRGVSAG